MKVAFPFGGGGGGERGVRGSRTLGEALPP